MRILVVAAAEVPSVANNKAAILGLNAWKGAEAWHCSVRLVDISATKTTSGRALTNARVRTHTHTHTHTHMHTLAYKYSSCGLFLKRLSGRELSRLPLKAKVVRLSSVSKMPFGKLVRLFHRKSLRQCGKTSSTHVYLCSPVQQRGEERRLTRPEYAAGWQRCRAASPRAYCGSQTCPVYVSRYYFGFGSGGISFLSVNSAYSSSSEDVEDRRE